MNQPQVFGEIYAEAYDSLYKEKDYDLEVSLLERLFQEYRAGAVHRILDVGCGTGNHAIRLAQRGYQVTGVDQSLA
ncbi:MAG: methyltransferase domain-containing protein, partial [Verrucomicrobiae bacterium]|nr:methyltransferase domain-containing protein [Verrucomicrobiae bacterium]